MQPEIAVLRFGLGARPGELASAGTDPRGWLKQQISGAVPLLSAAALPRSDSIYSAFIAARQEQRVQRRTAAETNDTGAKPLDVVVVNAAREVYQPHYRAQVLARAQSAATTARPFAERLVHFWSNHFAVSADKGVVYGLAGTVENEAIRPHVNGRFLDLLLAVEQHPAMIAFLDNQYSVGKDSMAAQFAARFRRPEITAPKRQFGINENL